MRGKMIIGAVAVAATSAAVLVGSEAAGASDFQFVGFAGGSYVRALNGTITSDLTAASNINGQTPGISDSNNAAGLSVPSLLTAGAVNTSTVSSAVPGGYKVVSESKTAGISALGGLITATAVDSISTATLIDGVANTSVTTQLLGIKIAGINLPVNIPPNYHVTIPNIATVYLNYAQVARNAPSVLALGIGIYVGLLKPFGNNAIGAALAVNPTYAAIGPVTIPVSNHIVSGKAYGTSVKADVGTLAHVQSDPTAVVSMAAGGTPGGQLVTSNVAGVDLTPLLHVGAVTDTAKGVNTVPLRDSETTAKIAGLNLFGGAIKADAITADAHVTGSSAGITISGGSGLVNVSIGGHALALNTAPNTVINVLGLGTVTINKQVRTNHSISVIAIDIVLGSAQSGLPVGAEVQLAAASAAAT